MLTAARSGEVRGAEWAEIDTEEHVWTVPPRASTLCEGTFLLAFGGLLRSVFCGLLPSFLTHGSRSTFRDWAAEETNQPREVVEAALAHVVQNKVEAAYARSDLFERA